MCWLIVCTYWLPVDPGNVIGQKASTSSSSEKFRSTSSLLPNCKASFSEDIWHWITTDMLKCRAKNIWGKNHWGVMMTVFRPLSGWNFLISAWIFVKCLFCQFSGTWGFGHFRFERVKWLKVMGTHLHNSAGICFCRRKTECGLWWGSSWLLAISPLIFPITTWSQEEKTEGVEHKLKVGLP